MRLLKGKLFNIESVYIYIAFAEVISYSEDVSANNASTPVFQLSEIIDI